MIYISQLINELIAFILALVHLNDPAIVFFVALVVKIALAILLIMMCVAYATWLERKIHGLISLRKGPNVVGPIGLLQPLSDGIKLLLKEVIIPQQANKVLFIAAPVIIFTVALLSWAVIPVEHGGVFANINVGVLYILAISSLGVYGILIAGWASNSQYALMGAIRSSAQMISYELSMGLIVVCVVICTGSFNLTDIVLSQQNGWYFLKLFPMAIMFFIIILAETNRHPFDLPEAESDIVAGYHSEYSGFPFALFFLAEYANMILMSAFYTTLFLGGWLPIIDNDFFNLIPSFFWFVIKVILVLSFMIQLKSVRPRYRYDQLMRLGWKIFLPLSMFLVIVLACVLRFTNSLPNIG